MLSKKRDRGVHHGWLRALGGGPDFPKVAKKGQNKSLEIQEISTLQRHPQRDFALMRESEDDFLVLPTSNQILGDSGISCGLDGDY